MANKTDGGVVVIGVEETGSRWVAKGLADVDIETWNYDDVHANVSNYADPYVDFRVETVSLDARRLIAIVVRQFEEIPVICKKDLSPTLRNGALYVRRRGKNETVEVPTHAEMREVIDRSAEVVARRMIATATRIGGPLPSTVVTSDLDKFIDEAKDLL